MNNELEKILATFSTELLEIRSSGDLENLRVFYLGKKGRITGLLKSLSGLPETERKTFGMQVNEAKQNILQALKQKAESLSEDELNNSILSTSVFDISLPPDIVKGSFHPVTLVQEECEQIFVTMGFTIEDYAEIVNDYQCFESLNIPLFHPARDMQDTFFLENGQLLKTHTSAAQNSIMKKYGAPLRAIFPGRCFRNESTDAGHENTFFQMEGMMIDENISISNLIYFMKIILSEIFACEIKIRLRPGFFPFVEPGFEMDIQCLICGGVGCSTCKNSGWLELCPCGMIHPRVLEYGGIDSEKYTGFAFGLGLTRLAMMKYGIKDIRDMNSGNLNILSQFT